MLARAVKDKLSIADTPAVTATVTRCASQESLEKESRSERLKRLQVTAREQMLKKLRAETPWTTRAVKDNEFANDRQKPKCKSKNHPSRYSILTRCLSIADGMSLQHAEEAWAEYIKISAECAEDCENAYSDRWTEGQLRLLRKSINDTIRRRGASTGNVHGEHKNAQDTEPAWMESRRQVLHRLLIRERCELMHGWPISVPFPNSLW